MQRLTDQRRLREIARYIGGESAFFPNNLIVNFDQDVSASKVDSFSDLYWLDIDVVPESAVIIDGQHRLLGIGQANIDIELPVTAFVNISEPQQAAIFRDINFFQRKVNKSLMYDLFREGDRSN